MAKYKIINGEGIIPNGTTKIENYAFGRCSELTSITIPESVTKIGDCAFYGCSKLKSITIPDSVTEIELGAFAGCRSLTSIVVAKGNKVYDSRNNCNAIIETKTNRLIQGCANTIIPDSVTEIGEKAFDECQALTSIIVAEENKVYDSRGNCNAIIETETNRLIQGCANTIIPESVTEVGKGAFRWCTALTSINIPDSVTKIGDGAFSECRVLASIIVAEENKVYDSRDNCNAIIYTYINCLIQGCDNTVIPDSVTEIGEEAFSKCEKLTNVNIPNSVTKIGKYAFRGCTALTSVNIPESVTKIGNEAFSGCTALTSINIPNSVTWIGEYAFRWCTALTSITIPNSVTWIGDWIFLGCENLKEIILFQTDPSKAIGLLVLNRAQITLYVPNEGVVAFQKDSFWSKYADIKPITNDMLK